MTLKRIQNPEISITQTRTLQLRSLNREPHHWNTTDNYITENIKEDLATDNTSKDPSENPNTEDPWENPKIPERLFAWGDISEWAPSRMLYFTF